jgi:hypothetical protein
MSIPTVADRNNLAVCICIDRYSQIVSNITGHPTDECNVGSAGPLTLKRYTPGVRTSRKETSAGNTEDTGGKSIFTVLPQTTTNRMK